MTELIRSTAKSIKFINYFDDLACLQIVYSYYFMNKHDFPIFTLNYFWFFVNNARMQPVCLQRHFVVKNQTTVKICVQKALPKVV